MVILPFAASRQLSWSVWCRAAMPWCCFRRGAGKSLCFQIPALCRDGVGIVVSPLIALMRDQVEALKQLGVRAAALNSSLSREEFLDVRRAIANGGLDLLYVTPERIVTPAFKEMIGSAKISLFAIDEAHCFDGSIDLASKQEVSQIA